MVILFHMNGQVVTYVYLLTIQRKDASPSTVERATRSTKSRKTKDIDVTMPPPSTSKRTRYGQINCAGIEKN